MLTPPPLRPPALALALLAAAGAPAAAQQFEHEAALPATSACATFRSEILPGVDSDENMRGLNWLFGTVRREAPGGQQCDRLRANRRKLENDRLLHNTGPYVRYSKERVFAWGNLCAVDICERGGGAAHSADEARPGRRPSGDELAARPPVSPDNPFAGGRRPSADNPFVVGRTPAPDNPFRPGAPPPAPEARPQAGKTAAAAPAAKPSRPPDRDPGQVRDAKSCVQVRHLERVRYRLDNRCPFAVNFVYSGRNFQMPVEHTADRLDKGDWRVVYSYHRYTPEIVWACAENAAGCRIQAASAIERRMNGR